MACARGAWAEGAARAHAEWNALTDEVSGPSNATPPSYAHVVGAINRRAAPGYIVTATAGGLPGELAKLWRNRTLGAFDCEFGYSCMGYEIAGGWGRKMAEPDSDVIVFTGDGSYLMMNSDIYSSVLSGHKLIVIVCDNGGFAVINRLQPSRAASRSTICWPIAGSKTRRASTSHATPRAWAPSLRRSTASLSWNKLSSAPRRRPGVMSSWFRSIPSSGRRAMPGGTSACLR